MIFTELDQSFIIVRYICISIIFQIIPSQFVYIIRRVIAVFNNLAILVHFIPQEFFSGVNKGDTLRGHIDCGCQIIHFNQIALWCIWPGKFQFVHQCIIIVTGYIIYCLCRTRTPCGSRGKALTDCLFYSGKPWYKSCTLSIGSGQYVAGCIIEISKIRCFCGICLGCHGIPFFYCGT